MIKYSLMKNRSLSNKISVYLILVSLIMTIIMGLISFAVTSTLSYNLEIGSLTKGIENTSNIIDNAFKSVDTTVVSLFNLTVLQNALNASDNELLSRYEKYNEIDSSVRSITSLNTFVNRLSIYGINGTFYSDRTHYGLKYSNYNECNEYFIKNGYISENNFNVPVWTNVETFSNSMELPVRSITNIRYYNDLQSYNRLGIIVCGIDEKALYKLYSHYGSNAFIVTKKGCIISHKDKYRLNTQINGTSIFRNIIEKNSAIGHFNANINGRKTVVIYCRIASANAYLVVQEDFKSVISNSYIIGYTTISLFVFCTIASILLSGFISKDLTSSVTRLKNVMERVKNGNMKVRFEVNNEDEINWLGQNFNMMLNQIDQYIEQIKMKEKSNRDTQLKLIQSQINPHLLYNTLDSILWHLENDDTGKAHEIIEHMSKFFKISLSNGNAVIPLRQEIEHVKNYISLQNLCRGQSITIKLDAEEELLDLKIVKLTLQPIVENSILHGFAGYRRDGTIKISIKHNNDDLLMTVEDNGTGMLEKDVEELNHKINLWPVPEQTKGYGLINVNRRIKHLYGENYGIVISSELGEYTRVTVSYSIKSTSWGDDLSV